MQVMVAYTVVVRALAEDDGGDTGALNCVRGSFALNLVTRVDRFRRRLSDCGGGDGAGSDRVLYDLHCQTHLAYPVRIDLNAEISSLNAFRFCCGCRSGRARC